MPILDRFLNIFLTGSPGLLFLALIFPVAFMWNDRFYGANERKDDAIFCILATAVVAWFVGGPFGSLAVILWWAYRSLAFAGGAAAPENGEQRLHAFTRHLVIIPLMAIPTYFKFGVGVELYATVAIFAFYTLYATLLANEYGQVVLNAKRLNVGLDGSYNAKLERKRGLAFGVAFALWITSAVVVLYHALTA